MNRYAISWKEVRYFLDVMGWFLTIGIVILTFNLDPLSAFAVGWIGAIMLLGEKHS